MSDTGEWGSESDKEVIEQNIARLCAEVSRLSAEVCALRDEVGTLRAERKSLKANKPMSKKYLASTSSEKNLKVLLENPILLANLPREYEKMFGTNHPLNPGKDKLGTYLSSFPFIEFDRSQQTNGTGPVWVSLKKESD